MRDETKEKIVWVVMWAMIAIVVAGLTLNIMAANGNPGARKVVCESSMSSAPGYCFEYWYEKLKTK